MTKGDGATVGIDLRAIELPPLHETGQRLGGEGLVELDDIDVVPGESGSPESGGRRLDRSDAEEMGVDTRHRPAHDASEGLEAVLAERSLVGEQQCGGAVVHG